MILEAINIGGEKKTLNIKIKITIMLLYSLANELLNGEKTQSYCLYIYIQVLSPEINTTQNMKKEI